MATIHDGLLEALMRKRRPPAPDDYGMNELPGQDDSAQAAKPTFKFDTNLSQTEEQRFQAWKRQYAPNDSGEDYDLRGAFKEGLKPGPNGHWSDKFKKPNHPTFSNESMYASVVPERAGRWDAEGNYHPPSGVQYDPDNLPFQAPEGFGYEDMRIAPEQIPPPVKIPGRGKLAKFKGMIPDLIDSSLAAVGTPGAGPVAIARALGAGRDAVRRNRDREAAYEDRDRDNRRRDIDADSMLDLRRRQAAAADAARERAMRLPAGIQVIEPGVYYDQRTRKVVDVGEVKKAAEREKRANGPVPEGMKEGSAVHRIYVEKGTIPSWVNKPVAATNPPAERPDAATARKRKEAEEEGWERGSPKYNEHVYGIKPEKPPAGMSQYQEAMLGFKGAERDDRKADKADTKLTTLEVKEYGDPNNENRPGIHAIRIEAGERLTAAKALNRNPDGTIAKAENEPGRIAAIADATSRLNAATRSLRVNLREKRDLGAISEEQYLEYMRDLGPDLAIPQGNAGGAGAATTAKTPSRGASPTASPVQREEFSRSRNAYRHTLDGGKTWRQGRLLVQ